MGLEMKTIKAVMLLEKANQSIEDAMFIDPDNDFLNDADKLIKDTIIILKTDRYNNPNNKDCLICSNSFSINGNRLICMVKQKAGKTVKESIVPEDGYCEGWN